MDFTTEFFLHSLPSSFPLAIVIALVPGAGNHFSA